MDMIGEDYASFSSKFLDFNFRDKVLSSGTGDCQEPGAIDVAVYCWFWEQEED